MVKIKHSKIKNTGLIYLILVRNISTDILNNKDNSPAITILKKYFRHGTQLNELYLLYNILLSNKVKTMQEAELLLTETINLYYRIDRKKLLKLKYNCILTIKEYYDLLQLFLTRVPLYKILASIYKIFESKMIQLAYNPVDIIGSKQIVLLFLINNIQLHSLTELVVENFIKQDKDIQMLAYKLLIEKFNKKYKNNLNLNQKCLLQKYLNSFSNIGVLKLYLDINVPIIINLILSLNKKIEDSVIKIKLLLVLHQLGTIILGKIIKDGHVIALLKTYSLLELLKNI